MQWQAPSRGIVGLGLRGPFLDVFVVMPNCCLKSKWSLASRTAAIVTGLCLPTSSIPRRRRKRPTARQKQAPNAPVQRWAVRSSMWKRPQTCPCFREINASSRRATHTDHADGADDADDEFEEKYRSG